MVQRHGCQDLKRSLLAVREDESKEGKGKMGQLDGSRFGGRGWQYRGS